VSFTAVTLGEPRYARAELEELSDWAMGNRKSGNVQEEPLDVVVARVKSMMQEEREKTLAVSRNPSSLRNQRIILVGALLATAPISCGHSSTQKSETRRLQSMIRRQSPH